MTAPRWLDPIAKEFWKAHVPLVRLTDKNRETFAVLCQCYAQLRKAEDYRSYKLALDYYFKFCKEFGLTPRSDKSKDDTPAEFF